MVHRKVRVVLLVLGDLVGDQEVLRRDRVDVQLQDVLHEDDVLEVHRYMEWHVGKVEVLGVEAHDDVTTSERRRRRRRRR